MGAPERPSGVPHSACGVSSWRTDCVDGGEWAFFSCWEGKTVERVAIEERLRMRRARIADSCTVGIWYCSEGEEGLEKTC